jgi:hypothetical protein
MLASAAMAESPFYRKNPQPVMEISPEVSVWALHLRRSQEIAAGKKDAGCKTGYR